MSSKPVDLYEMTTDRMMAFVRWVSIWKAEADKLDAAKKAETSTETWSRHA